MLWDRTCSSFPASDTIQEDDQGKNGFSNRTVVDLHKFLAAMMVLDYDNAAATGFENSVLEGLQIVASMSSSTSPRVNLIFRSNVRLRTWK